MQMDPRLLRTGFQYFCRYSGRQPLQARAETCLSYRPRTSSPFVQYRQFSKTPSKLRFEPFEDEISPDYLNEDDSHIKSSQQEAPSSRDLPTGSSRTTNSVTFPDASPEQASEDPAPQKGPRSIDSDETGTDHLRVIPASRSYFTAKPNFTDDLLQVTSLIQTYTTLPRITSAEATRIAWLTFDQYILENSEPIRKSGYARLVTGLTSLSRIHPAITPPGVAELLERFKRPIQPADNIGNPLRIDQWGRCRAIGRRKSSHAVVWLVEGDGQVRINGKTLTEMFSRLHDRESSVWPLKVTGRMDKYNVWAIARGGGTTGQADAIMLGMAKALLAHEPALKPALRRAGCVTRDPRRVERKKAGKLKARKMPTWVRR